MQVVSAASSIRKIQGSNPGDDQGVLSEYEGYFCADIACYVTCYIPCYIQNIYLVIYQWQLLDGKNSSPRRDPQRSDITLVYTVSQTMLYNVSNNPVIYEAI